MTQIKKHPKQKQTACKLKGQSTLEYLILVGAVVGFLIVFLAQNDGAFRSNVDSTYTEVLNGMSSAAGRLTSSWED